MILDTNALSAFVDGDAAVGALLRQQARAGIPVIVLGEFRYGIAQSSHRAAYDEWLQSQRRFEVLAVTDQTATSYATLRVLSSGKARQSRPTMRGLPRSRCSTDCPC